MQSLFDALLQDVEGFEDILIETIEEVAENQTLTTDPLPTTSLPTTDPLPTTSLPATDPLPTISLPTTDPLLTTDSLVTTDPLPTMDLHSTTEQLAIEDPLRLKINEPRQEMPSFATNPLKGFKSLDETALKTLKVNAYKWCSASLDNLIDFQTVSAFDLSQLLRKLYAEVSPKNQKGRQHNMTSEQAKEYHKNSMKNVRAAINRHLKDINRDFDIVKDKIFEKANSMLSVKLKSNLKQGLSRPTKLFLIIETKDLEKNIAYLQNYNPVSLRFKMWYILGYHFVTQGVEFHHQMKITSINFLRDDSVLEYNTLAHETRQKNYQGGFESTADSEETPDKRMYATRGSTYPIECLKLFL